MSNSSPAVNRIAVMPVYRCASLWLAMSAMFCSGCGPTSSTVIGVVSVDGKPLALTSDSRGTVVFQPAGGQGAMATGVLDSVGRFKLGTGARSEIVPGKYQVAISIVELLPATESSEQRGQRVTPARYSSPIDSGLQADVVLGENDFRFDLSSAEESGEPFEAAEASEAPAEEPTTESADEEEARTTDESPAAENVTTPESAPSE